MNLKIWDNRESNDPEIDPEPFRTDLIEILTPLGLPGGDIDVTFVSDTAIQELNREYRQMDRPTNVLSFPQYEWTKPLTCKTDLPEPGEGLPPVILGDVILSTETIYRDAVSYGAAFHCELIRMTVHGILHLFGFDHESDEDESVMLEMESRAMDGWKLSKG